MAESDELPVFHVVGFTGHRQLADLGGVERAVREVLTQLRSEAGVEWITLSSVAAGGDMAFARAAIKLGLGWEAVLPLPPAEFRRDFAAEGWREVETLLAEAEQVRVIGERPAREDAYLDCGMETVNHCDVLLAVWDGEPSRGRGGTAEVVNYARELGRPLIIIDARTLVTQRENFSRLKIGDEHLARLNRLPSVAPGAVGGEADSARRTVLAFHRKADHAATHKTPHFRRLTTAILGLLVGATGLASVELAFNLQAAALPWAGLLCLLGAIGIGFLIRHQREQHDWVRCRLAAEITRSALATWGLHRALRLFEDFDWAGLEPLRRSLDILQRREARARPVTFEEFKQRYLAERVDAQIAYFTRRQAESVPLLARLRAGFFTSAALALFCTGASAMHAVIPGLAAPPWVPPWIYGFGPVVLPVLAVGFLALVWINNLHRQVARYQEMLVRLQSARREASFVQTWGAMERVVAKVERALLKEVFEWHSVTSFIRTR